MKGLRIITEDWFSNNRIYAGISYLDLINKTFNDDIVLPKYTFTRDLYYGMVNDSDVKKLQEVLNQLGYFPITDYTGNYYGITIKAVLDFQLANGVIANKEEVGSGRCGPKTREVLNKLLNK